MDTELLVDSQINAGQLLIQQLTQDDFDVSVALWVRTSEDGLWYLIIASSRVGEQGLSASYQTLYSALDKSGVTSICYSDIKLMPASNPVARAAIELRDRLPARIPTRYHGKRLGTLATVEACIYPKIPVPLRQSFLITYVRQEKSNHWVASIKSKEFYRGLKAKDIASYSTAFWHGEKPEDQKFALVYVLVEVDPELDERTLLSNPNLLLALAGQARTLADDLFKQKHPDAVIEHDLLLATSNVG